jgi:hydroxyacylglutathione hydrolase
MFLTRLRNRLLVRKMHVVPVPVRTDNYAYLLIDKQSNKAAVVDPFDVPKVQAAADSLGAQIVACLTTHHHHDHSGGNQVGATHLISSLVLRSSPSYPGICV